MSISKLTQKFEFDTTAGKHFLPRGLKIFTRGDVLRVMLILIRPIVLITPKVFLRVQGAFNSKLTHCDAHIIFMFSRQYHINCLSIQNTYNFIYAYTVFLIFGRLYHINSETDMHIFSCFGRLYHINSQIFVYAFAPGRVCINAFC